MNIGIAKSLRRLLSMTMVMVLVFTTIISTTMPAWAAQGDVVIKDLRVEYMTNPIGIDSEHPRFSWTMESDTRGQKQTAYQILVSSSTNGNGDVWDSGKIESDTSVAIEFDGATALEPSTRYYWSVTVWDKDGNTVPSSQAYFETGLMSTDGKENWNGAEWIAMDNDFDTYTVEATMTLPTVTGAVYSTPENASSSLVFMAGDTNNYFNWKFSKTPEGTLEIDQRGPGDTALVDGNFDAESDTPETVTTDVYIDDGDEFTVSIDINSAAKEIVTKVNNSTITTLTDLKSYSPGGSWGPYTFPASLSNVTIAEGMVGVVVNSDESEHADLSASFDDVRAIKDGAETFANDFSSTNPFDSGDISDGKLVMTLPDGSEESLALQSDFLGFGAPMLRKEVELKEDAQVENARLYISALGAYDAYINGEKVGIVNGDGSTTYELLNPGWTNYERDIHYVSYDVTDYIDSDSVTLAAMLGDAWFNGGIAGNSLYYEDGNDLGLKAKLIITYSDDTTQTVVTDGSWKSSDKGPITRDSIYNGESYDARREIPGWNENGFDDSAWLGVKEHDFMTIWDDATLTEMPGNTVHIVDNLDQKPISITTYDDIINVGDTDAVKSGLGQIDPVESKVYTDPEEAASVDLTLDEGETAIYDLGQNMVGVPRITFEGDEGTTIRLRFAEMLNDDSVPDGSRGADGPEGTLYLRNLRNAEATDYYTLKGTAGGETYQPVFTFHGFRYMEVSIESGTDVTVSNVTGKVATSAIERTGNIETSNADVNRLYLNQIWGQYGNYLSIPTDCPQRDERAGWTGDAQLFANTALYNMNSARFLEGFQDILVDSQISYGDGEFFQTVSPSARYTAGAAHSGWSDVGVIIPWTVWQMTGDDTIIENNYDAMDTYMDYIFDLTGTAYRGPGSQYGDWLAFQGTSSELISDLYYAYDAQLMAQMANEIGNTPDAVHYESLFDAIKGEIINNYISTDGDGNITVLSGKEPSTTMVGQSGESEDNSQTALLWMLKLGVYSNDDQRQQMIDLLVKNIENSDEYKAAHPDSTRVNYAEDTLGIGFLGVNIIAPVLSEIGQSDLAYKILLQDEMPSWLYSVKNGATTIWERWDSYSLENGFGDSSMNSYNHYSYGAIAEWMYRYMVGINYDTENPGFKHIILQPTNDPANEITWAKGSYKSPYGTIRSEWEANTSTFTYNATVPANTTATVYIPAMSQDSVREGELLASEAEGINFVGYENGKAIYELESGTYEFTSYIASPENDFTVNTNFTVGSTTNATNLESDKLLDAEATVTNNGTQSKDVLLIVALYDANGSMVNVSYLSKAITGSATETIHAGFKLPSDVSGYNVKAFVWDGVSIEDSTMTPLSNVVEMGN